MKHQLYFPPRRAEQNLWLAHFQQTLPQVAPQLGLAPEEVAEALADIDWLLYQRRDVRGALDHAARAATALEKRLSVGTGNDPVLPLVLELPPPPAIPPVKPGALKRLFRLVRRIKFRPGYTVAMGRELGIEENHHRRESPVPTFTLRAEPGPVVVIQYSRYGHQGVYAEFRRNGGDWEPVVRGFLSGASFRDRHPLLDPARPEVREYRLRFWKDHGPIGDWTDLKRITVSP